MSTKAQGTKDSGDGSPGAKGTGPQSVGPGVSAEISAELASVAAALAGDDDEFSDVPTAANHTILEASPSDTGEGATQESGQDHAGAGAYRMVRPATSDRIDVHPTPSPDRPTARRLVIGVTRK